MPPLRQHLILLSTTLLASLASAACYDRGGTLRESWVACRPDLPTASCCSSSDFCMDNGLCLNAGGNQAYTQQGCTDRKWGPGCKGYCPIGAPSDGLYYMEYCWRGFDKPANNWCCGVQCCGDGTGPASGIEIPLASEIFRPGSRSASTQPAPGSGSVEPTATSISTSGPTSGTASTIAGAGSVDVRAIVLGVGLGLGIPLLLVIAAAGWMFLKIRKDGARAAGAVSGQQDWASKPQWQQHQWNPAELGDKDPVELPGRYSQYAR
ncbi:hypothetical protein MN608_00220 [Microdochium nivale]|nr:hypothetical protein MN608_00220 [Microdochium nivale]